MADARAMLKAPVPWGLALRFAFVTATGMLGWPLWQHAFTDGFCAVGAAVLNAHEFGTGGHVELEADHSAHVVTAQRDASWDAHLRLRIEGVSAAHAVSVNPRRLAYLPMLFFVAALVAAPLGWRMRIRCLALGLSLLALLALGSVWTVCAWLFARVPGLVYTLSHGQQVALDMLYEGLVTSMASKVIVPLLLAVVLARWLGAAAPRGDRAAPFPRSPHVRNRTVTEPK